MIYGVCRMIYLLCNYDMISVLQGTDIIEKTPDAMHQVFFLVGEGGFEPPKLEATDLQSAPFGHSGILPYVKPTA